MVDALKGVNHLYVWSRRTLRGAPIAPVPTRRALPQTCTYVSPRRGGRADGESSPTELVTHRVTSNTPVACDSHGATLNPTLLCAGRRFHTYGDETAKLDGTSYVRLGRGWKVALALPLLDKSSTFLQDLEAGERLCR